MSLYRVTVARVAFADCLVAAGSAREAERLALADAKRGQWDFGLPELSADTSLPVHSVAEIHEGEPVITEAGECVPLGDWIAEQQGEKP